MPELAVVDTLDWDTFVAEYWDRRPVLVRHPDPPFVTDEVFRAAVRGTRPPRPGIMAPNVQFTVGRYQQTEPGGFLPSEEDGSLDGYVERLRHELDGQRYALVVHTFHTFHDPLWRRQRDFYAGLWERVGLPHSGAITTLFHGTYEHSPVGVHKDRFATFMYALHGRKRMRFWPSCPWQEPVSSKLDYAAYLDSSTVADVEPGQLLYWPSSYFHVGESTLEDTPATSVNIGVPRGGHRATYDVQEYLYDPTPATLMGTESVPLPLTPREVAPTDGADLTLMPPEEAGTELHEELPPALARALAELRTGTTGPRRDQRVTLLSLRRWTGGGFLPAPAPAAPRAVEDTDLVRAVDPVRWSAAPHGALCAANGRATATELPPEQLAALVESLVPGTRAPVTQLLATVPAEGREAARRLLEALEGFGAVTVTRAGDTEGSTPEPR